MDNAYMIRSDGKAFPVTVHPYGAIDDPEETLSIAEWLYNHTQYESTKKEILELIAAYAKDLDPDLLEKEVADTLIYHINHLSYKVLSEEFIKSLPLESIKLNHVQSIKTLNARVNYDLNQEFLRARRGGMYDSDDGNVMYFRISSIGFNWFNIIWNFVYQYQNQISAVTVVKDPESTEIKGHYYKVNGSPIDEMPVKEFLTLPGKPVLDAKPIFRAIPLMNSERLYERLKRQHIQDAKKDFVFIRKF